MILTLLLYRVAQRETRENTTPAHGGDAKLRPTNKRLATHLHLPCESPPKRPRTHSAATLREDVEVGVEGRHDVARVGLEAQGRQARHGALQLRLGEEAEETDHGEAAVVDLGDEPLRLLLGGLVLGDLEGVVQVEWHWVRQLVEGGEVSRLAATHVVGLAVRLENIRVLAPELEEGNGEDDLPLGGLGGEVPHLLRGDVRGDVVPRALGWPVDAVGMDNVADEAEHGDTAVFDLRLAQEANRRLVRVTPELTPGEVQRVEVPDHRVQLLCLILQASQVHH